MATILDDEIQFGITSAAGQTGQVTVTEGATGAGHFATFTVTRSFAHRENPAVDVTETVYFSTLNGTAIAGKDFLPVSGSLTFARAAPTAQTILVPILDDNRHENAEQFTVKLSGGAHGFIKPTMTTGTVTITDNDPLPVVHVSSPAAIKEGNSGTTDLVFNVTLDRPNDTGNVTVDYSTLDPFSATIPIQGTLTFAPGGALQQQLIVKVPGNTLQNAQPVETFQAEARQCDGCHARRAKLRHRHDLR